MGRFVTELNICGLVRGYEGVGKNVHVSVRDITYADYVAVLSGWRSPVPDRSMHVRRQEMGGGEGTTHRQSKGCSRDGPFLIARTLLPVLARDRQAQLPSSSRGNEPFLG